jgi:hypothetical protein
MTTFPGSCATAYAMTANDESLIILADRFPSSEFDTKGA